MIGIIDYGSGNILAIANIYKRLNIPHSVASCASELDLAEKLILPGVGAFDETMMRLSSSGMLDALNDIVLIEKRPILGICVGMQIMAGVSEEGNLPGLSWLDASVKMLDTAKLSHKPYLPHMGWNQAIPVNTGALFGSVELFKGFYFLHSYYFCCNDKNNVAAITTYGEKFASSIHRDNVYGVQFHPEKSHANGIQVLKNFAEL